MQRDLVKVKERIGKKTERRKEKGRKREDENSLPPRRDSDAGVFCSHSRDSSKCQAPF